MKKKKPEIVEELEQQTSLLEKSQTLQSKEKQPEKQPTKTTLNSSSSLSNQLTMLVSPEENKKTEEKTQTPHKKESTSTSSEKQLVQHFGWKNLATSYVQYNQDIKEYVYTVEEPPLSDEEEQLKNTLVYLFKINTQEDISELPLKEKLDNLEKYLDDIVETNKLEITDQNKDNIYYYIIREFLGYGKIDVILHDDYIEDISCDGKKIPIFVHHREYESIRSNVYYPTDEELDSFVVKLSQICNKQISIYEPIIDGKLPDGSRLQATLAKTVTQSSTFTIRRFRERPLTPVDLINGNTVDFKMMSYFWLILEYGSSILFCGGTASGKTTALNALSLFIPPSSKIVSIEDTREINLPHENWIAGTSRSGFSTSDDDKSSKDIDMFDLIRAALRQRPRVIIVGEVRGKEAYTLFQAMATGHLSYSTMHASDIQTLIQRLESPPINLPRTLLTSLDVICFLKAVKTNDGKVVRRMTSCVEIVKHDPNSGRLISVTPFTWRSAFNDTFEYSGGSAILEKIQRDWGLDQNQLIAEMKRREEILKWMQEHDIKDFKEVGRIVAEYKKDPEGLYQRLIVDGEEA